MEVAYRESSVVALPRRSVDGARPQTFDIPIPNLNDTVVYLIDCPRSLRNDLLSLLAEVGVTAITFASAVEFLVDYKRTDKAACVILNISLPDLSGLEIQERLAKEENLPVIFISIHCDIASTVRAMKAGAIEFLTLPLDRPALAAAVKSAFAQDRRQRQQKAQLGKLQDRFSLLTPRECDVLPLIVGGLLNKQAASVLGISEVTLQIHRSRIMQKMRAESFADLIRMAAKLQIRYWRQSHPSDGMRDASTSRQTTARQQQFSSMDHGLPDASPFPNGE